MILCRLLYKFAFYLCSESWELHIDMRLWYPLDITLLLLGFKKPNYVSSQPAVPPSSHRIEGTHRQKEVGRCSPRLTRAPMRNPSTKEGCC